MEERADVIVVGAGNAGMSAAHAAREQGAQVVVLEKGPPAQSGGNSYFTAGAFRTTFESLADLRQLVDDLDDELAAATELDPYTEGDFVADMERVTEGRSDPELTRTLVGDSLGAMRWLHGKGIRFRLMYDRQSYRDDGRHRFWGGLVLGTVDGGKGLMRGHEQAAEAGGIEVRHGHAVVGLIRAGDGAVAGVRCRVGDDEQEVLGGAVVLAAGGFEADADMRAEHLGPQWRAAKVRGTAHNTGEALRAALDAGAAPAGDWAGCHAIQWDAGAPATGDWDATNRFSRQGYPFGLVVNRDGRRFLDEGADFRNYTYAKYGAEILRQPGAVAHQLFDARTRPLISRADYDAPATTGVSADSVPALAMAIGVEPHALEETVRAFNAAVTDAEFNPAVRDGKRTVGIEPPKSNWALPLDRPPLYAFAVTCGITFTFGGLRVDTDGRVLDADGAPMPGLHAVGEIAGGLFAGNYPGGSGLTAGAVFGRRAGRAAALAAQAGLPAAEG